MRVGVCLPVFGVLMASLPVFAWAQAPEEDEQRIEELLLDIVGEFEDIIMGTPGAHNLVPGKDVGRGVIDIWNRGSETAWPKFLVSSPGRAWIQDGDGRMVPMPLLTPQDGYMLVDTGIVPAPPEAQVAK